jgi:hypothetical protein
MLHVLGMLFPPILLIGLIHVACDICIACPFLKFDCGTALLALAD